MSDIDFNAFNKGREHQEKPDRVIPVVVLTKA